MMTPVPGVIGPIRGAVGLPAAGTLQGRTSLSGLTGANRFVCHLTLNDKSKEVRYKTKVIRRGWAKSDCRSGPSRIAETRRADMIRITSAPLLVGAHGVRHQQQHIAFDPA